MSGEREMEEESEKGVWRRDNDRVESVGIEVESGKKGYWEQGL